MTRGTPQLQRWNARLYAENARFVGDLADTVVELLRLGRGERILDIGCGDGYLTERLVKKGARVVGLDFSTELAASARARGIDVRVGDAETMDFRREFDGIFSNAALHWMLRPEAVVAGVERALKPGGRFVGEFAGAGNARQVRREIHRALERRGFDPADVDPWYLPTAEAYGRILQEGGLQVSSIELFDRPVVIDCTLSDWIRTFGSPYLAVLRDEIAKVDFLNEVTRRLAPLLLNPDGRWTVDYTRLRFRAEKP
jgi:trans-aconitate methyltransferase